MPSLAASYSAFANAVYSTARHTSRHALRSRARYSTTLLHPAHAENYHSDQQPESSQGSQKTRTPEEVLKQKRLEELQYVLAGDKPSPSRVWTHYTSLMNVAGYNTLPVEIHQSVLRLCAPSLKEMHATETKHLHAREKPEAPHIYESRFQTIIRNIRASGTTPSLEDYHFILEQFSVVGHHVGAMHVYKELIRSGVVPEAKTYGLMLRTIVHRLSLPARKTNLERRNANARQMLAQLIPDMQKFNIGFTSVNLDLVIRALKATLDRPTLEMFMKAGYGIDINNPDHPPIVEASLRADLGFGDGEMLVNPNPQTFSVAALNTTLDILGNLGDVSKMIQTFEVLTQPLPSATEQFSSFDDDDDFLGSGGGNQEGWRPPHVVPNSTTYCILLRHICRLGHPSLARHYLNEVMFLDKFRDWGMRKRIYTTNSFEGVAAPRISINRGMLVPVFGHSNRNKDLGLMRWLDSKLPGIIKRKKENIDWYTSTRAKMIAREQKKANMFDAHSNEGVKVQLSAHVAEASLEPREDDGFEELVAETPFADSTTPADLKTRKPSEPDLFELDLDSKELPKPDPWKHLDVDLHIRILERDLEEIEQFQKYVKWILGRTHQRVKERLGRRVWDGKDIYLQSENARVKVDRSNWRQMSHFQPRPPTDSIPTSALPTRRNRVKRLPQFPSVQDRDPKFNKYFNRSDDEVKLTPPEHGVFKDFAVLLNKDKQS